MKRASLRSLGSWGAFAFGVASSASCQSENEQKPVPGMAGSAGVAEPQTAGGGALSTTAGAANSGRAGAGSADQAGLAGAAASAGGPGASGAAGSDSNGCDAESVGDLQVYLRSSWDPLGYPPYAFDGCQLVYVASGNEPGALRLRNLATSEDTVLEPATSSPRRPAISGSVIAWEVEGARGSEVRVLVGDQVTTMSGAFVRAEEPRATGDAVVFTAFLGPDAKDDSDVYLFDVASRQLSAVASGPGQQRFADVSATHVAFTDFAEDPHGYFDEAGSISDIALIERASGTRSTRVLPGKQAFPLLSSDGVFAYLEWGAVHPEPKLGQFWLKVGNLERPVSEDLNVKTSGQVSTDPAYVRPSLHGLNLDFVDKGADGVGLYRARLGTPGALLSFKVAGSLQLFGPVAGDRFTLLANQRSGQSLSLLAVPR